MKTKDEHSVSIDSFLKPIKRRGVISKLNGERLPAFEFEYFKFDPYTKYSLLISDDFVKNVTELGMSKKDAKALEELIHFLKRGNIKNGFYKFFATSSFSGVIFLKKKYAIHFFVEDGVILLSEIIDEVEIIARHTSYIRRKSEKLLFGIEIEENDDVIFVESDYNLLEMAKCNKFYHIDPKSRQRLDQRLTAYGQIRKDKDENELTGYHLPRRGRPKKETDSDASKVGIDENVYKGRPLPRRRRAVKEMEYD